MKNWIAKHKSTNLGPVAAAKPLTVKVKQVMLLEVEGDSAFTDDSIKVKAHNADPNKLVLKCTRRERLLAMIAASGFKTVGSMFKGKKHWICFVWKKDFQQNILGGVSSNAQHKLDAGGEVTITMPPANVKALGKGGAQ